jgi:hypothetical protein
MAKEEEEAEVVASLNNRRNDQVLVVVRDKVVHDLTVENEILRAQQSVLLKAPFLHPPSFAHVEIAGTTMAGAAIATSVVVVARTLQFPDANPRCECCCWYSMTMMTTPPGLTQLTMDQLAGMILCFGSVPDLPLSKSTADQFHVHQVQYPTAEESSTTTPTATIKVQVADAATGARLHLFLHPVPPTLLTELDTVTSLSDRRSEDWPTFCRRLHDLAPNASVQIGSLSIPHAKAVALLTSRKGAGGLSEPEAYQCLRIPPGGGILGRRHQEDQAEEEEP